MAVAQPWVITQLTTGGITGGGGVIKLSGYAAPFGRPRQKAIGKEIVKSRVQTTYYPGRDIPTRHTFGNMYEPMELNGRWMTKATNADRGLTANQLADIVAGMIQDGIPVRIAWGNIISYIGYLEELELGRESENEIAWRLKILIDGRDSDESDVIPHAPEPALADQMGFVDDELASFHLKTPKSIFSDLTDFVNTFQGLSSDFLEQIDGFVRDLNAPSAALNKLAGVISDGEKATFSTLQHLRSAIKGIEQAFGNIRDTVLITPIDASNLVRTVESDVAWIQFQLDLDVRGGDMLALLAAMDRQAELQQRKEATGTIICRGDQDHGESWESMSIRAFGDASHAGVMREMNGGITHTEPGAEYLF